MKHENMRNFPPFLGPIPHPAGQPVVTVNEIIVERLTGSEFFQLLKKLIKMTIKSQFIHLTVLAGP
jgi:hypothetical protein